MSEEEVKAVEQPLVYVDAHEDARVENPDGSVTLTLLVEKLSIGHTLEIRDPYNDTGKLFTNWGLLPAGKWPVRIRLDSMERSETIEGVADATGGIIELIADMHRMVILISTEEHRGKIPTGKKGQKTDR